MYANKTKRVLSIQILCVPHLPSRCTWGTVFRFCRSLTMPPGATHPSRSPPPLLDSSYCVVEARWVAHHQLWSFHLSHALLDMEEGVTAEKAEHDSAKQKLWSKATPLFLSHCCDPGCAVLLGYQRPTQRVLRDQESLEPSAWAWGPLAWSLWRWCSLGRTFP